MVPTSSWGAWCTRLTAFFGIHIQILTILFAARFVIDSGNRIVYPFIPQFSEGLGLTIVAFSWLIFVRAITGVLGPVFGVAADKYGRRKIMAIGLLGQAAGAFGVAVAWQWWTVIPMFLFGLNTAAFIPAQQAYISDRVAYQKRGRALATIEFSWAVSGIVSLPIIGWMIDSFGWQMPLLTLGVFSLAAASAAWAFLPAVEHQATSTVSLTGFWRICTKPNVLAAMGTGLLMFVAVSIYITVWGIWLTADFGLAASTVGLVATGVSLAELAGSGLSGLFIDRIGKKRGSIIGLLSTAVAFLLLPFTQASLVAAILALILLGVCAEYTIVSLIPLYSEQAPQARATVFSLTTFGVAIGVAIGAPIATTLWKQTGLWSVSLVAAGCLGLAVLLVAKFLKDSAEPET